MLKQSIIDKIRTEGRWKGNVDGWHSLLAEMGFSIGRRAEHTIINGCNQPDDSPEAFRAFKNLLDYLKIDHTLLENQYCCGWQALGKPAWAADNTEDFALWKEFARETVIKNYRQAEALGAKDITVFCAACEASYTHNADATSLEVLTQSQLLERYYPGGKLDMEIDYFPGCYRFRKAVTDKPLASEAPLRLLERIEGLRINYLDDSLCCRIPDDNDRLAESLKTKTVVTTCVACYGNITRNLKKRGVYQVKMLPEILWDALLTGS